ncbi:hypothetical protein ACFPM7_05440 [Actinokineospora guangxiensis]|uniref:Uncharacterized protein n=1 Tax=Actinokineospora guangxiensis TaxID=1490288 RepID=A0ABW0EGG7_9PSEU
MITMGAATVVQRRFGHRAGGVVVGLPLTMAPFLVVLLVGAGPAVAGAAARGSMVGQLGVVAFCLVYAHLAHRGAGPLLALLSALGCAGGVALGLSAVVVTWVALPITLAAVIAAGRALPPPPADVPARRAPWWELPARAAASTAIVVVVAGSADVLGPRVAGVLAAVPVVLAVITPPTHHRDGRAAAEALLRGTLRTLPAATLFAAAFAFGLPLLA